MECLRHHWLARHICCARVWCGRNRKPGVEICVWLVRFKLGSRAKWIPRVLYQAGAVVLFIGIVTGNDFVASAGVALVCLAAVIFYGLRWPRRTPRT
jgi:hypothetical protein